MAPKFPFIILTILLNTISSRNGIAQSLFPAILIFGDSTVNTGNNNFIVPAISPNRADHRPYGKDFPTHKPTGRFSNGKLVLDFLADTLGLKEIVPPYLDPSLSDKDLITGVSFGSAGSGFDDLTSVPTRGISMSKQLEYFRKYVERVEKILGEKKAKEIIKKALVIINAGTNDFVINYYDLPTRRLQYNITGYQDFVLNKLQSFVQELHELGCRTMVVTGLAPIGCLPIQMTARFKLPRARTCLEDQNSDVMSYNEKLRKLIPSTQTSLPGTRIFYADVYKPFIDLSTGKIEHEKLITESALQHHEFVPQAVLSLFYQNLNYSYFQQQTFLCLSSDLRTRIKIYLLNYGGLLFQAKSKLGSN